jgi:hypothetical protein
MPLQAAGLHDEAPQLAAQPLAHGTISRPVDDVADLIGVPVQVVELGMMRKLGCRFIPSR